MGFLRNRFVKKEPVGASSVSAPSNSPFGAQTDDVRMALAVLEDAYLVRNDEELQKHVDEALDSISATGESGIDVLFERLYRDMKVVGSDLQVRFGGDSAWNEWLKKKSIVSALGRSRTEEVVPQLGLLLMSRSDIDQFYNILHPTLIRAIADIGGKSAIEWLRRALDSGNIYGSCKRDISDALAKLDGREPASDANARDKYGVTPLHRAARTGRKDAVEELLTQGADINIQSNGEDVSGCTSLHLAALEGHNDVVELLIAKGADVNSRCDQRTTPLHRAAAKGRAEISEMLLEHGADINARTSYGRTPLWWAERNFHATTKEVLLRHGGTL